MLVGTESIPGGAWFDVVVFEGDVEGCEYERDPSKWTTSALTYQWPVKPRQADQLAEAWYDECGLQGEATVTLEFRMQGWTTQRVERAVERVTRARTIS